MNTTEATELAAELRKAAQDLLLCVNAIMGQEQSIADDLLRNFPKRLELLALRVGPHPQPDLPPDWPPRNRPSVIPNRKSEANRAAVAISTPLASTRYVEAHRIAVLSTAQ